MTNPIPDSDADDSNRGCHGAEQDLTVLTVDEAAKLLRISRGLAFAAVRTGTLPHIRIGRRILIPRAFLTDLLRPKPDLAPPF